MPIASLYKDNSITSESLIWDDLRNGEIKALGHFYQLYFSMLLLYGKRLSASETQAEDAIQDLFLKLWRTRTSLSPITSVKGYLLKSYRRIVLDKMQNSNKMRTDEFLPEDLQILSAEDILIENELHSENRYRLTQALKSLTTKQKEIIYLRFYNELSYDEIAEMLGINNQTVRNSISTSIKSLRKVLAIITITLLKMIA